MSNIIQAVNRKCPIAIYCPTGLYFTTLACAVVFMIKNPQYSLDAVQTFVRNERESTLVQEDMSQMKVLYDLIKGFSG
jgi:hypothetical protein